MGKIRIKTVGEEQEKKEKKQEKRTAKAPGLKGGERVVSIGPSIEELEKEEVKLKTPQEIQSPKEKKAKFKQKKEKFLSKRYKASAALVKRNTRYPLEKAVELLKGFEKAHFDETVELHVNVKEKGVSGQVLLPHGTGKKIRVKVADDAVIERVESGKIDFDILVAKPEMMPKLAKVAKILGPKGLMPNPKTGTISDKPEVLIEKFTGGQMNYKTEAQAPIIHLSVGKLSFNNKQLSENIKTILESIGEQRIVNITLKSSMSPGIKLETATSN